MAEADRTIAELDARLKNLEYTVKLMLERLEVVELSMPRHSGGGAFWTRKPYDNAAPGVGPTP